VTVHLYGMEVPVSKRPEQHGVFYPRGYVIITFQTAQKAEDMRQRLLDGGYEEDTERVKRGTSEDLKHLSPVIKALGSEGDLIRGHQTQAAEGNTFLLAYAPSDLDTQRLMNVARDVGYHTAHKYDRFTIASL
jgi:hypothetical protein